MRDEPETQAEEAPLVPPGNGLRPLRGGLLVAVGCLSAWGLLASPTQLRLGVPLGALAILVATVGLLDLVGAFDDPDDRVAHRVSLRSLALPLVALCTTSIGTFTALTLATAGTLPPLVAAVAVPAWFLGAVVALYRVGERLGPFRRDEQGAPRPLHRRHGFWVVAMAALLYLPMLGNHGLIDPWETHYGEVAREILSRDDWISLWWGQDGWFWSKPVLNFWTQALAMAALGVHFGPGEMLAAATGSGVPAPEWAVRFPVFLFALVALYLLYKAVAAVFGRRAGLLGALVLATMPQWFFVVHQTMADMPFVATMSAAMALFLLGVHTDPQKTVRAYEIELGLARFRVSGHHLVVGAIVACALPQILYLVSRNVDLRPDLLGFRVHADVFSAGSPGNCGIPGNEACRAAESAVAGMQPALQAVFWAAGLALLLFLTAGERRAQRLLFLAAWFFAALSTMAKGPAGFGMPALTALVYVVVTRRYRDLTRMELASGAVVLLIVAMPWFVAMYGRHGEPFTDRLIFHDMYKRAFSHVHDTNEGDDTGFRYYVWQLGYATFPWSGLVPVGLAWWLRRREGDDGRTDASILLALWFWLAFALFTLMGTKFHHYILPAVPPAAMLVGVVLDDMIRRGGARAAGAASEGANDASADRARYERLALGAAAVVAALVVALVGRDLLGPREGMAGQARLLHLFTYSYKRLWPGSLDFKVALAAFTAVAATFTFLLCLARIRRFVVGALCAVALAFAAWGLDVYFVRVSPHWGQRETVLAYLRERRAVDGPLVAYQLNWKGENFYLGNRIPVFVSSGAKFTAYVLELKKKGHKDLYFLTEHSRAAALSTELGNPRVFEKLTTPELNNKFLLVRARFE